MEKEIKAKGLVFNTAMMYLMSIAKLIIPLVSLIFLTNVLSESCYGSVSFVKSVTTYLQLVIEFGFLLSATKEVINCAKKKEDVGKQVGNTLYAQLILVGISAIFLAICCIFMDILEGYELFAFLYFISIALSVFMFEYVFKAYERMDKIAIRYVVMKFVALILTIIFVKNDSDIYLMPIFEIISSLIACVMVWAQLKKLNIKVKFSFKNFKNAIKQLKNSFVYFMSDFATSAFSILNTFIIGLMLTSVDVAYWSVALQVVSAIQALYTPIINSVYPRMIKDKNLNIIHKIMLIYMPIIFIGCGIILICGDWAFDLVFKPGYQISSKLLKCMIPMLIFSFPTMLYGWPCLGSINKQKATTISTIVAAVVQVLCLIILILINKFTIINVAILRNVSEITLCLIRMGVCYRNKKEFSACQIKKEQG